MTVSKSLKPMMFLLVLSILVFSISYLPYAIAEKYKPDGATFTGQVAYSNDQNMYFSFIRQGYLGKILFNNRLTQIENPDHFFNIQFLCVGKLWKILNLSENSIYQLWRLLGVITLLTGFYLLVTLFFSSSRQRWLIVFTYCLAGGFGLIVAFLAAKGFVSKELFYTYGFDLWAGIFPFQQMLTNPHFSLPHGLFLIGTFYFLRAYSNQHSIKDYIVSGITFALCGLIRPYDLISLFVIIPLFAIVEMIYSSFHKKKISIIIPLLISLPSFVYSTWLFKLDPVFKWWSLQGYNISLLPLPHVFLLSYGIFSLLFALRLFKIKTYPLSDTERFLLVVWISIFGLTNIGHIIPWMGFSPQIAVPLFSFMCILAFKYVFSNTGLYRKILLLMITCCTLMGFTGITVYMCQKFIKKTSLEYYLSNSDAEGFNWLKKNVFQDDVILSTPQIASRLAKYTDAQVVAGHYSVTPDFLTEDAKLRNLYKVDTLDAHRINSLFGPGVSYLYINKSDTAYIKSPKYFQKGLNVVFNNSDVVICKVEKVDSVK